MHSSTPSSARRALVGAALSLVFGLAAPTTGAAAADWPAGSVQLIAPAKPGGGTDAAARIIASALQDEIEQGVVVVNNPAGGGAVAAEQVRTAAADGQTLLFFHTGILSVYHTGGYNHSPVDEFTTVLSMPVGGSYALVVAADSPYKSVSDLVDATKKNPNSITLGVQLRGSTHFMAGLLTMDSKAAFRIVEAGSDADKLVALQGHQLDAALINTPGTLQYVQNGDLRILATIGGSPDRDPAAPDYATLAELGYPSVVYGLDFLVLGPKDMDKALAEKINAAFAAVLSEGAAPEQLSKMGMPLTTLSVDQSIERLKQSDERVSTTAKLLGLN